MSGKCSSMPSATRDSTIVGAATGDEAVELPEARYPGMVVTDIKLPRQRDSIDVTVAARRIHPGIPVLFIAGLHWRLADAKTLGGPAVFPWRPFSLTALPRDLDRLMEDVGQSG